MGYVFHMAGAAHEYLLVPIVVDDAWVDNRSRCPLCLAICKSGGSTWPLHALWSRCHCWSMPLEAPHQKTTAWTESYFPTKSPTTFSPGFDDILVTCHTTANWSHHIIKRSCHFWQRMKLIIL